MSVAQLERHLESSSLAPVYGISSSDAFLLSEAVSSLRKKAWLCTNDFSRDEFRVGEMAIDKVISIALTLPMMAPRRWVYLADVHKLKAKDLAPLAGYLEKPSPQTILCLSADKFDQRTKAGQLLAKLGTFFNFETPKLSQLPTWVSQRGQVYKKRIEISAATTLVALIGADLAALDMALRTLSDYVGERSEIQNDDVENLISSTRTYSVFEFTDALVSGQLPSAERALHELLDQGDSAIGILGMLARTMRQLLSARSLLDGGARQTDILAQLAIPPRAAEKLLAQARKLSRQKILRGLLELGEVDKQLKSSRLSPSVVLERYLLKFFTP